MKKKFIYIYIYYSSWNEKKKQCRKAGWATAHFPALCHDTMYCIMIGKGIGAQGCAARPCDTAGEGLRYGGGGPAIWPRHWPRHGRLCAKACSIARAAWLMEGRDTKFCIVAEGTTLSRDTASQGCDTAQQ